MDMRRTKATPARNRIRADRRETYMGGPVQFSNLLRAIFCDRRNNRVKFPNSTRNA
jgi:phytoene/squalene synthetase